MPEKVPDFPCAALTPFSFWERNSLAQCDQMARQCAQFLPFTTMNNYPIPQQICQRSFKCLLNTKLKLKVFWQILIIFPKLAKLVTLLFASLFLSPASFDCSDKLLSLTNIFSTDRTQITGQILKACLLLNSAMDGLWDEHKPNVL